MAKKILFNDRYGLTEAVLQGTKTMTRRIVPIQYVPMIEDGLEGSALIEAQSHGKAYREGEIVAVTQSYQTILDTIFGEDQQWKYGYMRDVEESHEKMWEDIKGRTNKMFVKADLMPYQIQITDIKMERLQDISDEDCICEGVTKSRFNDFPNEMYFPYKQCKDTEVCYTPRGAFQILIDRVSGKGTWESNPYVFCYSFELIK